MDGMIFPLLLSLHIFVGLCVIGLVLVQHGKGADMGAAFGGGSSGSLFGSSGSANFLSRTTAVFATIFFISSLGLSYMATNRVKAPTSVMEQVTSQPAIPTDKSSNATGVAQPAASDVKAKTDSKEIPK